MPWVDWSEYQGPSYVGAPQQIYRLGLTESVNVPDPAGPLVEVPLTTGFTRRPFARSHRLLQMAGRGPLSALRLRGLAHRSGLLRAVTLSPETGDLQDLLTLCRHHIDEGHTWLHMMLHTQSLAVGLSPFAPTAATRERVLHRTDGVIEGFVTLTELADEHLPPAQSAEPSDG